MHPLAAAGADPATSATERSIPELVAEVYEAAPPLERQRLFEALMCPLGLLSLFGIASGVFADLRLRNGWQTMHIGLEDLQGVQAAQVIALADHAQQVSVETVDGLAQLLMASPVLAGTAAAAMLVTLLVQRARSRQSGGQPVAAGSRGR